MATTLPTFTITDPAKEERVLAAFRPSPTATVAETAAAYKEWLRKALIEEVFSREANAIRASLGQQIEAKRNDVGSILEP